ncbi:MAG: OmpA family protein [Flavobacteriaceae bacterium]|nr:OmpA family protein [Flavobacteriaceae bacterium]
MNKFFILLFVLTTSVVSAQLTAASYRVKSLNANSKNSDFGTTFYGKDKIVFSSSRQSGISGKKWDGNDQPFLDLYIGEVGEHGEIIKVKPFSSTVNSKYHDAMVAFSPDLRHVYFTSNNYMNGELKSNNLKIFRATIGSNGQWRDIATLPFNSDNYDTGHPSISEDGTKLYFTSNMPGGYGDTDLYVVTIHDNHYGKPVNLGPTVNSKYKEYTPSVDGNVLYFSSNRPGGQGGLDIYMTKLDASIPEPINLGKPMNSKGDDISFIIDNEKQKGYFSSNRRGGKGDDDIYSFVQVTVNPICDQTVSGVVLDKISGEPIPNAFATLYDQKGNKIRRLETLADGKFFFNLKCDVNYKITADRIGYFDGEASLKTSELNGFENELTIALDEKEFITRNGKEMLNIKSIRFELNKAVLLEDSKDNLAKVVRLMDKFPNMVIEFGSHTDARAPDGYNMQLSRKRAMETVRYLISMGVDYRRITGKGYGETQLVNKCSNGVKCTEIEHQQNKRTEFLVLKK